MRFFKRIFLILFVSVNVNTAFADEIVKVTGEKALKVANYNDIDHVYDRFEHFPIRAREGISLEFIGDLLPEHKLPSLAHLIIHSRQGDIPLFVGADREMRFIRTGTLKAENPPVLQTRKIQNRVQVEIAMVVHPANNQSFNGVEARHWLDQINNCIEDLTGVILSWFMPDAHRLKIELAPHSQLTAQSHESIQVLADNRSQEPKTVILRPQSYSKDTVFSSNKPFRQIRVKIPGNAYVTFMPQD